MATKKKMPAAITSVVPVKCRITIRTLRAIIIQILSDNTREKRSKWYCEGIAALQTSGCIPEWVNSKDQKWLTEAWDMLRNTIGQPVDSSFANDLMYVCNEDEASCFVFANDTHRRIVIDWLETHRTEFFDLLAREVNNGRKARRIEHEKNADIVAARKLLQSHGYTITRNDSGHLL